MTDVADQTGATVGATAGREIEAGLWGDAWRQLRRNPLFLLPTAYLLLMVALAVAPGLFTSTDPMHTDLARSLERPSAEHWFGFDLQGRDYYARVIYGARASIVIGITVVTVAGLVAIVFGTLAGYYGGIVDSVIARIADVWFGIPTVIGGIVFLNVLDNRGILQVGLVLSVLGWPTMLRIMRSSVLSAKQNDYVLAARALGARDLRIMRRHVVPNALAPVVVYATLFVGIVISAEATLSFLGVGLQLPAVSWGLMISGAQTRILQAPHLLLFPGLFLSLTVLSFSLVGDALRDALDPKLR
jgi:ABC-type dipeptide/oligopeptide/nickel transport system permease subunit